MKPTRRSNERYLRRLKIKHLEKRLHSLNGMRDNITNVMAWDDHMSKLLKETDAKIAATQAQLSELSLVDAVENRDEESLL